MEVTKTSGLPDVYLPLTDPKRDRNFLRALREDRVLSLKQEPAGAKKDFGTVGFLSERYVSYLVFPKPLTSFKGRRIVGIKYDALSEAALSTPHPASVGRGRSTKPTVPPKKPKPRPKRYAATVRLTSTNDVRVTVEAFDEREARAKVEEMARKRRDLPPSHIETELLSLSKGKET